MNFPDGTAGLTFDTGALIGIERGDPRAGAILVGALKKGWSVLVPAGALGQAWRGGAKQARLARFLGISNVKVISLDEQVARSAGELCGQMGHADLVDASVAMCALEHNHAVVTSDPGDIAKLAPRLPLIAV